MTVEGWIEEEQFGRYIEVFRKNNPQADANGVVIDVLYSPRVEFLPEPVQFKDGDVVLFPTASAGDGSVAVRQRGVWNCTWDTHRAHDDSFVRELLSKGLVVRLVPEANGD